MSESYDHFEQYRPIEFCSLTEDQIRLLHEASLEIMPAQGCASTIRRRSICSKKPGPASPMATWCASRPAWWHGRCAPLPRLSPSTIAMGGGPCR